MSKIESQQELETTLQLIDMFEKSVLSFTGETLSTNLARAYLRDIRGILDKLKGQVAEYQRTRQED